ncbi:jun dimerization protein 2-like isoform X2 [Heterodontus francisci]|uniref:jun dimerization protein 2-like isoform X2 n=2 Tax=Heterodontus francisci TaxID=7792 RepID=UPI00355C9263
MLINPSLGSRGWSHSSLTRYYKCITRNMDSIRHYTLEHRLERFLSCVRRRSETRALYFLEMMPGQIPDPSLNAGSLPVIETLMGMPTDTLTTEELKFTDLRHVSGIISPLHFLGVKYSKRQQTVKSETDQEDDERRKRRREKNKVAAARCRNKKKERTEFLQKESERLELMNSELKAQIEELKEERQQLIHMLNRHRPTCIVRTDSVKTPESETNPLLDQLKR